MTTNWKIGISIAGGTIFGVVATIGGIAAYRVYHTPSVESKSAQESGWLYDQTMRTSLKTSEVLVDSNSTYTSINFKNTFNPSDIYSEKSIYFTDHKFGYKNAIYQEASVLANNVLRYNKSLHDNKYLVAWDNPSNYKADHTPALIRSVDTSVPVNSDKTTPTDKAVVWLQGGPLGDNSFSQMAVGSRVYQKIGHVFTFAQSQYGFDPRNILMTEFYGKYYLTNILRHYQNEEWASKQLDNIEVPRHPVFMNDYKKDHLGDYNEIIKKLKNFNLSEDDALKVLSDVPLNTNQWDVYFASSMAFAKIDADMIEALGKKLKGNEMHYQKTFLTGLSYGHTEVMNALLYNNSVNKDYDGFMASSNSIWSARNGSQRLTGGYLSKEQANHYKGGHGTLDYSFFFATQIRKIIYGQQEDLKRRLSNLDFKKNLNNKLIITANKEDFNIGNIGDDEQKLFRDNHLTFNYIDNKLGHNNLPTNVEEVNKEIKTMWTVDTWWPSIQL